jgi:hypothetical protein
MKFCATKDVPLLVPVFQTCRPFTSQAKVDFVVVVMRPVVPFCF